jgi:hypothetical protein
VTRNARDVGGRIEELLGGLTASRDRQAAEELVRLLVETYGNALGRIVGILRSHDPALVDELVSDELVESLLLVHDTVRPYLGSHAGGVEYLGVDDGGVARLRLEGNCDGCPSSTLTVHAHGPHRRPAATPTVRATGGRCRTRPGHAAAGARRPGRRTRSAVFAARHPVRVP